MVHCHQGIFPIIAWENKNLLTYIMEIKSIFTQLRRLAKLKINGRRHFGLNGHLIGARDLLPYNGNAPGINHLRVNMFM